MRSFGNSARGNKGKNKGKVPASLEMPRELTPRLLARVEERAYRHVLIQTGGRTSLSACVDTNSKIRLQTTQLPPCVQLRFFQLRKMAYTALCHSGFLSSQLLFQFEWHLLRDAGQFHDKACYIIDIDLSCDRGSL